MNGVSGGYHINGCGEQLYVKSLSLLFSGSVSCYCIACVSGNQLTLFAPMSTKFSQLKEVNLEASRFFHHIMPTSLALHIQKIFSYFIILKSWDVRLYSWEICTLQSVSWTSKYLCLQELVPAYALNCKQIICTWQG